MSENNDNAGTAHSTLNLSPFEIYTWALQGPFNDGHESAVTMAKILYLTRENKCLANLEKGIVSHVRRYDSNTDEWEAWRKEFIRKNLHDVGWKKTETIKKIENDIQHIDTNIYFIQSIAKLLKNHNEVKGKKIKSGPNNIDDYETKLHKKAILKTHTPSQQASNKKAPIDDSKDIIDKIIEKFKRATMFLSAALYVVIFFASWGALIAGNLVLGIAFGWIPALIVTFIASIFAPLVILASGIIILTLIALAIFSTYYILI